MSASCQGFSLKVIQTNECCQHFVFLGALVGLLASCVESDASLGKNVNPITGGSFPVEVLGN
jgi:hypothetical protein